MYETGFTAGFLIRVGIKDRRHRLRIKFGSDKEGE
jgi:hypothetical protein